MLQSALTYAYALHGEHTYCSVASTLTITEATPQIAKARHEFVCSAVAVYEAKMRVDPAQRAH